MKTIITTLLLVALTSPLGACGFHLKGFREQTNNIALTQLHVKGNNRYDDIAAEVKQKAKAQGIKVTSKAEWSISMNDEQIESWQASSTQSYTTNDYYLRVIITFQFHHQGITYQPITLFEEAIFQDNTKESSSKNNEREILLQQLRETLAESILRRLKHIANNPPACDINESQSPTTP